MPGTKRYTARDRLAAHVVLILVFCMVLVGIIGLYMTGLFKPVEGEAMLGDTEPLNLKTAPPSQGMAAWLFPSAAAEEAPAGEEPAAETAPPAETGGERRIESELEELLAQIAAEERSETEISEADRVTVDRKDLSVNESLPEEWFNVLLLAVDGRELNINMGRTDVMMIASINAATGEIKLSSLARDLYIPIPLTNSSNRLNAAFAYGGAELAMKTVNEVFELNIRNYVLVNFRTMADIVDSIGGVEIPLVGKEYYYINYHVAVSEDYEGFEKSTARRLLTEEDADVTVHLDGLQAVSYARIRMMDDDLKRSSRQRVLLQAMLEKVMHDASLPTLIGLFNSMSRTTETNLAISRIMDLSRMLLLAESITVSEFTLPVAGSFRFSVEKDARGKELDVMVFAREQNVQALHEYIYGEYTPAES